MRTVPAFPGLRGLTILPDPRVPPELAGTLVPYERTLHDWVITDESGRHRRSPFSSTPIATFRTQRARMNLIKGETIVARAHHHWILQLTAFVWFGIGTAVGAALVAFHQPIAVYISTLAGGDIPEEIAVYGPLGLGSLIILLRILKYIRFQLWIRSTEYAVTNRRIVMKSGLIRRNTFEVLLSQLETVAVHQGLIGRILGYGAFSLTGTGGSRGTWGAISGPLQFKKRIESILHSERSHAPAGFSPVGMSPAPPAAPDLPVPVPDGPGQFRIIGVNRESGKDAELIIDAQSAANAKVKGELSGLVVTDVQRMGSSAAKV